MAAALILFLAGCRAPEPDEVVIRNHLETMTAALAEGNARAFMAPIAEDFAGETWNLDRRAAHLLVRRELMAREKVRVRLIDTRIEAVGENRAIARFNALATGGSGLIPDEGRLWRVETGWRRTGGDWELISASWEPVIGR